VNAWYRSATWLHLLRPLAWLFAIGSSIRRIVLSKQAKSFSVPVIIVGNLTVGGTGKTPLLIAIAYYLMQQGYRPGIVSRGYRAQVRHFPKIVLSTDTAQAVGDEPYCLARATHCPVVIDPRRVRGVQYLLDQFNCTVILSDDGLQHYALHRDIEIVVIDGERRFGNGYCLPAGPLREPLSRLNSVDFQVVNGVDEHKDHFKQEGGKEYAMTLQPLHWVNLKTQEVRALSDLSRISPIQAVAGIGNPDRFFKLVRSLGYSIQTRAFSDHYPYGPADFKSFGNQTILMTEKDAVKCEFFAQPDWWYLAVVSTLEPRFWEDILLKLRTRPEHEKKNESKTA